MYLLAKYKQVFHNKSAALHHGAGGVVDGAAIFDSCA
ncbi:MAG: hypothetical protein JWQ34_407 [Mucilaginibacter sp.]|nr:hypothetical protein [Mucilaginibacter sp.]